MDNSHKKLLRTPRIAIDALGINEVGGGRTATLPLIKSITNLKRDWQFFCFLSQFEPELNSENVKQIVLPASKGVLSRILAQFLFPFFIIFYNIDLIHFVKSQASFVLLTKRVMTIYDCTTLKYPQYFSKHSFLYWKFIQPFMCKHMNQIITISNHAKSEIEDLLKVSGDKISVIYPASQFSDVDPRNKLSLSSIRSKYKLPDEYLLYVGQIGMKKNLHTIINAFSILKNEHAFSTKLILVGPRYFLSDAGEVFTEIKSLGLSDYIYYLGSLPENELYALLENAKILLFPSVHEGFGLPMLEAMQLGIPVIASNTSVMPEVLQNAGVVVDDFLSPAAWANAIIKLYDSYEDQEVLSQKGVARARDFSWDISADQLIKVYQSLL